MAKIYAEDNALYKSNVEALTRVQPEHIPAEDIDVRLGTTWIEPEDYEQFIYELLEVPERLRRKKTGISTADMLLHGSRLNTHRQQKEYFIENKFLNWSSVKATSVYGTPRMDAFCLIEASLNLRSATVRDRGG